MRVSIERAAPYLREFQILSNIVADKVQFTIVIDREEESVESLEVNMLMDLFSFIRVPNDLARDDKRDFVSW